MIDNIKVEEESPKAPLVFPQLALVCGIIQTILFLFSHSKQGVTIWLPIVNLLGIFVCCVDLYVSHYFKKFSPHFKTFRFVFLLDLLNGFFFFAAVTFVPLIFTTQENMWIYLEYKAGWYLGAIALVVFYFWTESRSSIKKIHLTRARMLFSGVGLAKNAARTPLRLLPILIFIMVIAIYYSTSRTFGRYDLYLFVLFVSSILGTAQTFASCLAAAYQLFVRFEF